MNDWARGDARDGIRATQRAHLWFICQEQRSVQIVATDCHTIHSPPHQTGMQNVQMGHFKPKLHRFSQTQVRYTRPCSNFWVMLRYKVEDFVFISNAPKVPRSHREAVQCSTAIPRTPAHAQCTLSMMVASAECLHQRAGACILV